jgi:hypothetical protein
MEDDATLCEVFFETGWRPNFAKVEPVTLLGGDQTCDRLYAGPRALHPLSIYLYLSTEEDVLTDNTNI